MKFSKRLKTLRLEQINEIIKINVSPIEAKPINNIEDINIFRNLIVKIMTYEKIVFSSLLDKLDNHSSEIYNKYKNEKNFDIMIDIINKLRSGYYIENLLGNLLGQPESNFDYNYGFIIGNKLYNLMFNEMETIKDKKENKNRNIYEIVFGTKESLRDITQGTSNLKRQSISGTTGVSQLFNTIASLIKKIPNYREQIFAFDGIKEPNEKMSKKGFSMRDRLYLGAIRQLFKGDVIPFRYNDVVMFSFSNLGLGEPL